MDNIKQKLSSIIDEIGNLKVQIVFEGSKFINKIIADSSNDPFVEFLRKKLETNVPVQAPVTQQGTSFLQKMFGRTNPVVPAQTQTLKNIDFEKLSEAIKEWDKTKQESFSSEKFKVLRIFTDKITVIQKKLMKLIPETKKCDELKRKFKTKDTEYKQEKYFEPTEPSSISQEPPASEPASKPVSEPENLTSPEPKSRKKTLSPEEIEAFHNEKLNELLSKVTQLINSSSMPEDTKIWFNEYLKKDSTINYLRQIIQEEKKSKEEENKKLYNRIKNHIDKYEATKNQEEIEAVYSLLSK